MKHFAAIVLAVAVAWATSNSNSAGANRGPRPGRSTGRGGAAAAAPRGAQRTGGARHPAGPSRSQYRSASNSQRLRRVSPGALKQPPGKGPNVRKAFGGKSGKPPLQAPPMGGVKFPGKLPGHPKVKPQTAHSSNNNSANPANSIQKNLTSQLGNPGGYGSGKPGPAAAQSTNPPTSKQGPAGKPAPPTKGKVAQKINLAKQYALAKQGDLAVQLGLYKKGGNAGKVPKSGKAININVVKNVIKVNKVTNIFAPKFKYWQVNNPYIGWVGPAFGSGCFWMSTWGPYYYPKHVLYPKWSPWVSWCWYYKCPPLLDPRPLWCRPVFYALAPRWVYWAVPVWTPLPVVSCGTWVDVAPVVVGAEYDLQLLAIRFVDGGHPEEQLGPRYRVWFRNNSTRAIHVPFNVMLFASVDGSLSDDLPQAGVRVTSIEAGEVQAVDVRLRQIVG